MSFAQAVHAALKPLKNSTNQLGMGDLERRDDETHLVICTINVPGFPRKVKLAVEVKTDKLGNRVRMIAFLPENVPLEKREAVMEYLIGVNHTNGNGSSIVSAGHFDMDVEDGEVRFRVAVAMDSFNSKLLTSVLSNMLDAIAETGDNWSQIVNLMR